MMSNQSASGLTNSVPPALSPHGNTEGAPAIPQLAIASILPQQWEAPCEPSQALSNGTIFPCLYKPFFAKGGGRCD